MDTHTNLGGRSESMAGLQPRLPGAANFPGPFGFSSFPKGAGPSSTGVGRGSAWAVLFLAEPGLRRSDLARCGVQFPRTVGLTGEQNVLLDMSARVAGAEWWNPATPANASSCSLCEDVSPVPSYPSSVSAGPGTLCLRSDHENRTTSLLHAG